MGRGINKYINVGGGEWDCCGFYKLPTEDGGYVLSHDEVFAKLDELLALGGDLAAFNGGFNPHLPLSYYWELFGAIRARDGDGLGVFALTVAEFLYLGGHAALGYGGAGEGFEGAGPRSSTAGGSTIF